MEKEVIWSTRAKNDLQAIYEFNSMVIGEEKAFQLIERLVKKTDLLSKKIKGGTRHISSIRPEINYQKLLSGYHLIIYREDENATYINRIFDGRQDAVKNINLDKLRATNKIVK